MSPSRNAKSPIRTSARRAAAALQAPVVEVEVPTTTVRAGRGRSRSTAPAAAPRSPSVTKSTNNNNKKPASSCCWSSWESCKAWNGDCLQNHFKQGLCALVTALVAGALTWFAISDRRFEPLIESWVSKALLCVLKPLGVASLTPRALSIALVTVAVGMVYCEGLLLDWCPPLKKCCGREFNLTTLMSSFGIMLAGITSAFHVGLAEGRIVHLLLVFIGFRGAHFLSGLMCCKWTNGVSEFGGALTAFTLLLQSILKAR